MLTEEVTGVGATWGEKEGDKASPVRRDSIHLFHQPWLQWATRSPLSPSVTGKPVPKSH